MRIQFVAIIIVFCAVFSLQVTAQQRCGTTALATAREARFPGLQAARDAHEAAYRQFTTHTQTTAGGGDERVIPVVVHLIQLSNVPAISDARVQSQIDVLNEDFGKMNADTSLIPLEFQGVAANCKIRFCLATIDPNGCPTNGINRVVAPELAVHSSDEEADLKGYVQWDPYRYLNMWVPVNMDDGLLGYATFPDWLGWDPGSDGVVVNGTAFGRGFGTPAGTYNLGRTTTHEVGHWLGLYHTFDGSCTGNTAQNCLSQGDRVCDTPPTSASNFGCPGVQNTCTEFPTDMNDQTMNFMDYTDDACMQMFSIGQLARMDFYLNSDRVFLWSDSNLTLSGCDGTVSPGCVPLAAFQSDFGAVCTGQSVQFHDQSTGPSTSWNWTFQGGTPATSTMQNPIATWSSPGTYTVTLIAANAVGSDTITSTVYVAAGATAPLAEGFETGATLPQGWYETSQSNQWHWETDSIAASLGQQSVVVHNYYQIVAGLRQDLISAPYNLAGAASPILTFDHAYKRRGGFNIDSLQVYASTDCGDSWQKVWERTGAMLATVPGFQANSAFVPNANQWTTDSIDLAPFAGASNFRLLFRSIGGNSQELYLDNLNLSFLVGTQSPIAQRTFAKIYPNPASETPNIEIHRSKQGNMAARLLDVYGQVVFEWSDRMLSMGMNRMEIPAAVWGKMPVGLYLLELGGADAKVTAKIVKVQP